MWGTGMLVIMKINQCNHHIAITMSCKIEALSILNRKRTILLIIANKT